MPFPDSNELDSGKTVMADTSPAPVFLDDSTLIDGVKERLAFYAADLRKFIPAEATPNRSRRFDELDREVKLFIGAAYGHVERTRYVQAAGAGRTDPAGLQAGQSEWSQSLERRAHHIDRLIAATQEKPIEAKYLLETFELGPMPTSHVDEALPPVPAQPGTPGAERSGLNRYQLVVDTVQKDYTQQRVNAVSRGANTDRLRHLDLQLATCQTTMDALSNATSKANAQEIVWKILSALEAAPLPAPKDHVARSVPLDIIRDKLDALPETPDTRSPSMERRSPAPRPDPRGPNAPNRRRVV